MIAAIAVAERPASADPVTPTTQTSREAGAEDPASASTRPTETPATASSTQPATREVYTQATPRDALKFFAAALRDGDADRLRRVVLTANDAEDGMVVAIADMARALGSLYKAAADAFGAEAAGRFTEDTAAGFEQTVARIDAAEVTLGVDTAIVRYADAKESPYELTRVGDDWKVPATQFTHGAGADVLARRVGELRRQAGIVRDLQKEIADGKHKSAEAAGLAWRNKMMAALSGDGPKSKPAKGSEPATRPATQPTGE